jgi:elongation factor 1-alpha
MDCDVAKYGQPRYDEVKNEMKEMLVKIGWKKEFVDASVPVIPISGWIGDNLITKSANMAWWTGVEVTRLDNVKVKVETILDALEKLVVTPPRAKDKAMRMPVSGIYQIKGAGDVITGRIEQGSVLKDNEVAFVPTHGGSSVCTGKVFSIEQHHKKLDGPAVAGDNVGMNIKGLNKENMPHVGDVMVLKSDTTLSRVESFTAQVQVLNHPGELKAGYTPVGFVRTGRSALKMTGITWKIGKETGNKKAENPVSLKANEMAEVVFAPQQPFVVDSFKNCEGLGRVAIMEGNGVVMLGKIVSVERKAAK